MKILTKKLKNLTIYSYLSIDSSLFKNQNNLIDFFVDDIYKKINDFKSKKILKDFIISNIFGYNIYNLKSIEEKKAQQIILLISSAIKDFRAIIKIKNHLTIVLLPNNQSFVKEKMHGSTGYTVSNKTIFIFVNQKSINSKNIYNTIKKTLAHEYNHSIRLMYFPKIENMSLLDNLVFEGFADNFQINIIKGSKVPIWSRSLSEEEARKIFKKINNKLNSTKQEDFIKVFFENKDFPLWAGYSIGYYMTKSFLKNYSNNDWNNILKINSKNILKKINW